MGKRAWCCETRRWGAKLIRTRLCITDLQSVCPRMRLLFAAACALLEGFLFAAVQSIYKADMQARANKICYTYVAFMQSFQTCRSAYCCSKAVLDKHAYRLTLSVALLLAWTRDLVSPLLFFPMILNFFLLCKSSNLLGSFGATFSRSCLIGRFFAITTKLKSQFERKREDGKATCVLWLWLSTSKVHS